jgi:hypothetical protein
MDLLQEKMAIVIFFIFQICLIKTMNLGSLEMLWLILRRGLSASCIVVPEVFFTTELVDFFMTKNSNPKFGQIEKKYTLRTRFIKNPNFAKEFIKQLAIDSGCNAILNLTNETDTFSAGNYQYTVHAFKGDFAIVSSKAPCASIASNKRLIH